MLQTWLLMVQSLVHWCTRTNTGPSKKPLCIVFRSQGTTEQVEVLQVEWALHHWLAQSPQQAEELPCQKQAPHQQVLEQSAQF